MAAWRVIKFEIRPTATFNYNQITLSIVQKLYVHEIKNFQNKI